MARREEQRYPADPSGIDEPHDVLAAEEFAMPTRDERYPADPSGIHEPHDVLAAEEFAMPTPGSDPPVEAPKRGHVPWLAVVLLAAALAVGLWRRR